MSLMLGKVAAVIVTHLRTFRLLIDRERMPYSSDSLKACSLLAASSFNCYLDTWQRARPLPTSRYVV
jgi:hypothetical protein